MTKSYTPPSAAAVPVSDRASTSLTPIAKAIQLDLWPTQQFVTRPFLKWTGSKRRLLEQILPLLPSGKRLVEPFVGGGSVFAATGFDAYLLADINPALIALYAELRRDPAEVIANAKALFVDSNCTQVAYNGLRARFNDPSTSTSERAALFVYLNKFGFNGLYRVNNAGKMNTPFAHHIKVPGFPGDAMVGFANRLAQAELRCSDFATVMELAVPGDVVYCDPVYVSREDVAGREKKSFSAYDSHAFGIEQHVRLAALARSLSSKGIPVVISNNDTFFTRQLYAGAELHTVEGYRSIAASSSARGRVAELVAVFRA
jgi:DNA adenine methylase